MICCSNTCKKCNSCGKYIYNLSTKYRKEIHTVESLATYGWGSISTDKCEVHYICGPDGNYALYEPVVIEEELSDKDLSDIFLENISKKESFEIPDEITELIIGLHYIRRTNKDENIRSIRII